MSTALATLVSIGVLGAGPARPETRPTLNMYGATGLIDMPSAEMQPDGILTGTSSHFGPISRSTLSFQITPRLSGSFRYQGVRDWNKRFCPPNCGGVNQFDTYFDRSFDLRYQILDEGRYMPAVVIGLQDFAGTGVIAGEYVVATKHVTPDLKVTAGLGWGRLGSHKSIGSPFGDRPSLEVGTGGSFNFDQWFRGPAAPFAGIEWQINDKWTAKAEYSSDAYREEAGKRGTFDKRSPLNFGIEYQASSRVRVGVYSMYGSEVGVNLSFTANPKQPMTPYAYTAPLPVKVRPPRGSSPEAWSASWVSQSDAPELLAGNIGRQLEPDGIKVQSLRVDATTAELRIIDGKFDSRPNAIGRAARAMAFMLPASVEEFRIIPMVKGQPTVAVTIRRSDLERLEPEPNASEASWSVVSIDDAARYPAPPPVDDLYPRLSWSVGPYFRTSYFDPDNPFRAETGLRASAQFEITPGLEIAGSVRKRVVGNLDDPRPASNSVLPRVRTDYPLYDRDGDPALEYLTVAKFARPAANLYARGTIGYLEPMFAGVSGELLWKRPDSRYALGVEVNYAKQRATDMRFGLQDYDVLTGHVSAYADLGKGYSAQLDVGRYLAGDVGATLSLDREFGNGWRVGAFATKTNVSAEEFGEGSFDKGIRVTIPLTWITGQPSQTRYNAVLRPTTRDGGARLDVRDRLYDVLKQDDAITYGEQWGRFWK
ncbi:YjbH domain-containing protein [Pseudotabrizicola sp. 4114]|uniref:YjbH domain-containing protein n=1 Tax=Pseudotabrizicola sp. 4114 TaxID=2817731 RepID=UPI0032B829D7